MNADAAASKRSQAVRLAPRRVVPHRRASRRMASNAHVAATPCRPAWSSSASNRRAPTSQGASSSWASRAKCGRPSKSWQVRRPRSPAGRAPQAPRPLRRRPIAAGAGGARWDAAAGLPTPGCPHPSSDGAGLAKIGVQPDTQAATALVAACVAANNMEVAQTIFDELFGEPARVLRGCRRAGARPVAACWLGTAAAAAGGGGGGGSGAGAAGRQVQRWEATGAQQPACCACTWLGTWLPSVCEPELLRRAVQVGCCSRTR